MKKNIIERLVNGKVAAVVLGCMVLSAAVNHAKADTLMSGTAIAYFNFSKNANGSGTADTDFSMLVTSSTLFASNPTININKSVTGSRATTYQGLSAILTSGTPNNWGGGGFGYTNTAATSINPVTQESMAAGTAMRWGYNDSQEDSGAGNPYASFTLTLNTTGLEDLRVSMDYRATSQTNSTRYLGLEYKVGDDAWVVISYPSWGAYANQADPSFAPQSSDPANNFAYATSGTWRQGADGFNFDLSAYTALDDQSSVQLRFTSNILNLDGGTERYRDSFTIDNLAIFAAVIPVPEPSALVLLGVGVGLIVVLKRQRNTRV